MVGSIAIVHAMNSYIQVVNSIKNVALYQDFNYCFTQSLGRSIYGLRTNFNSDKLFFLRNLSPEKYYRLLPIII